MVRKIFFIVLLLSTVFNIMGAGFNPSPVMNNLLTNVTTTDALTYLGAASKTNPIFIGQIAGRMSGTNIVSGTLNSNALDAATLALISSGGNTNSGIAILNGSGTNTSLTSPNIIGGIVSGANFAGNTVISNLQLPFASKYVTTDVNSNIVGTLDGNNWTNIAIAHITVPVITNAYFTNLLTVLPVGNQLAIGTNAFSGGGPGGVAQTNILSSNITDGTGTGQVVRETSPVITTPTILGTMTIGTMTVSNLNGNAVGLTNLNLNGITKPIVSYSYSTPAPFGISMINPSYYGSTTNNYWRFGKSSLSIPDFTIECWTNGVLMSLYMFTPEGPLILQQVMADHGYANDTGIHTGTNSFTLPTEMTNVNNKITGTFTGSGNLITSLQGSNITGTVNANILGAPVFDGSGLTNNTAFGSLGPNSLVGSNAAAAMISALASSGGSQAQTSDTPDTNSFISGNLLNPIWSRIGYLNNTFTVPVVTTTNGFYVNPNSRANTGAFLGWYFTVPTGVTNATFTVPLTLPSDFFTAKAHSTYNWGNSNVVIQIYQDTGTYLLLGQSSNRITSITSTSTISVNGIGAGTNYVIRILGDDGTGGTRGASANFIAGRPQLALNPSPFAVATKRYDVKRTMLWNNLENALYREVHGLVPKVSGFSSVVFDTDATTIGLETMTGVAYTNSLRVKINGVFFGFIPSGPMVGSYLGTTTFKSITVPSGTKRVEIYNPGWDRSGDDALGASITAVYVNVEASVSFQSQPANSNYRVVVWGDSICVAVTDLCPFPWPVLMREELGGSVTIDAISSDSFTHGDSTNAPAKWAGAYPTDLWLEMGRNDFYFPTFFTTNQVFTAYSNLVDKAHSYFPEARIWIQTPTAQSVETDQGSHGTLPQWRAMITNATTRAYTRLVDGTTLMPALDPYFPSDDGVHPNTMGNAAYARSVIDLIKAGQK